MEETKLETRHLTRKGRGRAQRGARSIASTVLSKQARQEFRDFGPPAQGGPAALPAGPATPPSRPQGSRCWLPGDRRVRCLAWGWTPLSVSGLSRLCSLFPSGGSWVRDAFVTNHCHIAGLSKRDRKNVKYLLHHFCVDYRLIG